MPAICPKCHYARKESDSSPEWQCPACQVAYSKVGDTPYLPDARVLSADSGFRAARETSTIPWKWLLVLAVIAAVAWQSKYFVKREMRQGAGGESSLSQGQPEIIFYSASWCGYCNATRAFFKDNGIRYTEHDVESSTEGVEGHRKLGGGGVPLILVGGETVRGFNESGLKQMLGPWMRRR